MAVNGPGPALSLFFLHIYSTDVHRAQSMYHEIQERTKRMEDLTSWGLCFKKQTDNKIHFPTT